jgi:hypothetical protein
MTDPDPMQVDDDEPERDRSAATDTADDEAEPPHPLLRFSTEELRAELARRQRQVEYLKLQHGALLRQVAELEAQMAKLSPSSGAPARTLPRAPRATGTAHGPRAPRATNAVSLTDAILAAVPPGGEVTPAEVAERVLASGFRSNAQRFGVLVATALSKDRRFERLARGRYRRLS